MYKTHQTLRCWRYALQLRVVAVFVLVFGAAASQADSELARYLYEVNAGLAENNVNVALIRAHLRVSDPGG